MSVPETQPKRNEYTVEEVPAPVGEVVSQNQSEVVSVVETQQSELRESEDQQQEGATFESELLGDDEGSLSDLDKNEGARLLLAPTQKMSINDADLSSGASRNYAEPQNDYDGDEHSMDLEYEDDEINPDDNFNPDEQANTADDLNPNDQHSTDLEYEDDGINPDEDFNPDEQANTADDLNPDDEVFAKAQEKDKSLPSFNSSFVDPKFSVRMSTQIQPPGTNIKMQELMASRLPSVSSTSSQLSKKDVRPTENVKISALVMLLRGPTVNLKNNPQIQAVMEARLSTGKSFYTQNVGVPSSGTAGILKAKDPNVQMSIVTAPPKSVESPSQVPISASVQSPSQVATLPSDEEETDDENE